jgi:hypothetical protein
MDSDILVYTASYVSARAAVLLAIGYLLFRLIHSARRPAFNSRNASEGVKPRSSAKRRMATY